MLSAEPKLNVVDRSMGAGMDHRRGFGASAVGLALAIGYGGFVSDSARADGALAMGTERGRVWYGASSGRASAGEARSEAMRACSQHGPCRVETVFWNKCLSVAWVGHGNRYAWATRDTPGQAEGAAVRQCERNGDYCKVVESRCDRS